MCVNYVCVDYDYVCVDYDYVCVDYDYVCVGYDYVYVDYDHREKEGRGRAVQCTIVVLPATATKSTVGIS